MISSGEGSSASIAPPAPTAKPIGHDGDTPVFPAQVPVTDKPEAPAQDSPPLPVQELPADPHDVVPPNPIAYHHEVPELPPGQSWDQSALGNFFGVAHREGMKPSVVKAGLQFIHQARGYLQTAVASGSGFETELAKMAEAWKDRAERMGATPKQIQASLKAGIDWLEKNPSAIFDSPESPAPRATEDMAPTFAKLWELEGKGLKDTHEYNQLKAKLTDYFRQRAGGDYVQS